MWQVFFVVPTFHEYLNNQGIPDDHIIEVALNDRKTIELRNPDKMLQYIDSLIKDKQTYYILLDEVQMMEDFADVLNSLLHIRNADVYVTGSNSRFLSKDVVTEFRGRGDEIHLQPLSFAEYYSATGGDKFTRWKEYINTLSKYYFSDIGIRNALLDFRQLEETHIMENVIYNELLGRGAEWM